MFVYRWTLKLFLELRMWEFCECVGFRVTQGYTQVLYLFVLCCLLTHICCSAACVYALCWSLIKFPIAGFIIFIRQKRENYEPINPCVWSSAPLLLLCLLPSLFHVPRLLFTRFSSGPPCLWCWEVICLYARAVLSPAYPIWLLQTSRLVIIIQICERLRFGRLVSFVFVFFFSLFIRDIYIPVCLCRPCLTTPIFYCYFVNTIACLASGKSATLSPWGKFYTSRVAIYHKTRSKSQRFVTIIRAARLMLCHTQQLDCGQEFKALCFWGFQQLLPSCGSSTCLPITVKEAGFLLW